MKLRKKLIAGCVASAFLIAVSSFYFHKVWPYGGRTCCLPCTLSALEMYAGDHFGWFPQDGKTPLESLQSLYSKTNDYIADIGLLAGISGNREETQKRVKAGLPVDESVSSWIYFPGFRDGDDSRIAIIWERQEGISLNGRAYDGHAVGFLDGSIKQIPQAEWAGFLKEQEALRQATLAKRKN